MESAQHTVRSGRSVVHRIFLCSQWSLLLVTAFLFSNLAHPADFDFEKASRDVPKPRELWPIVSKHRVPREFKILSDEIVNSDTVPGMKLRKVTVHFWSQELEGKKWGHPSTILMPVDTTRNADPERRGKVVIVSNPGWQAHPDFIANYGEPIASRTGYPTMVMINPGRYADGREIEGDIAVLSRLRKATGEDYYNMNCQLAVSYIQAVDAFQDFLGVGKVKAVVGGHSKRGRSATVAAAMDDRVAGVVIMGNEGIYSTNSLNWHLSFHHAFFQEQVTVPVLYLGASNESGYRMFNVNIMQGRLQRPMTLEVIPNYHHDGFHDKQYLDFMMWVAHVHDGRPLTRITEVTHRRENNRTHFRARIEGEPKRRTVKAWFTYTDDAQWRDLMWYHVVMRPKGDYYEGSIGGVIPDAFMVEVGDIARGFGGYVSSLPVKLTDAPVENRRTRRSYQRPVAR